MAIEWSVVRLPVSTESDFVKIESELADREETGWDLEHIVSNDGSVIMFFKKRTE